MNTGQTIITLGALVLLSSVLVNFYGNVAQNGVSLGTSEAGISQISLASSYFERAQGLAFDENTDNTFAPDTSYLTPYSSFGIDPPKIYYDSTDMVYDTITNVQNKISTYNDFDDFNNTEVDDTALASSLGTFHTSFKVYYVKPESINIKVNYKTFTKRIDMKIWRRYPQSTDTLRASKVFGYFHFD